MSYNTLTLLADSNVVSLTFNRPEKRNAISPEMIDELLAALDEIEHSPARVAILTGAGKAFCSGMDLESLKAVASQANSPAQTEGPAGEGVLDVAVRVLKGEPKAENDHAGTASAGTMSLSSDTERESSRVMAAMFRRIYDFPKPLIAAVNGPAIAGGCGIATLCDFTLAVPEAKFGYTEVRIGFIPAIVSVFLIRQIGEKRARDLLLTGRVIDAAEALHIGLITEIVPAEKLLDRARQLAEQLVENSPTSLASTKGLLCELSKRELDQELDLAVQENARIRSTADFREGLSAFLEKRKPLWGSK